MKTSYADETWEYDDGIGVLKRDSFHFAQQVAKCMKGKDAKFISFSPKMLKEIDNAIDILDPEMMRQDIVHLRERLIRFRVLIES